MRLALLADIHANVQALEAVLDAISREQVDEVLCLGDIVGYNANPRECIELVRREADFVVAGNHDWDAVRNEPALGTSPDARRSQEWTRRLLTEDEIRYLRDLPNLVVGEGAWVAVHGCYLNDVFVTGYVTSTMLERNLRVVAGNRSWPSVSFCGHTHAPLCGWLEGSTLFERRLDEGIQWPERAQAVLINPGSVGQPRDGDPRASFALVDFSSRTAVVKRVAYHIDGAVRAIRDASLPETFAIRLAEGR